jgi:hypothetical protein
MKNIRKFIVIPSVTGTDGEISVSLLNATFEDLDGAIRKFPEPEFGPWLIEQMYQGQRILATKKGILKKSYVCPDCSSELDPDTVKPAETSFELQYLDFAPFRMKISFPGVVCPQCQKLCGIDRKGSFDYHLAEALLHAFRSKNIRS